MNDLDFEGLQSGKSFLGNDETPKIKDKVAGFMFDKDNPEMITYLFDSEIMAISSIQAVVNNENKVRKALGIEENPFYNYLNSLKVHRTSRKGYRSEQAVKIIASLIDDEQQDNKFSRFGGLLGGKR